MKNTVLTLIRDIKGDKAIFGKLYFNGGFVCFTLENRSKAIHFWKCQWDSYSKI